MRSTRTLAEEKQKQGPSYWGFKTLVMQSEKYLRQRLPRQEGSSSFNFAVGRSSLSGKETSQELSLKEICLKNLSVADLFQR